MRFRYQNSTFPIAVYGCIDTASRKVLWIKCWTSNSDPKRVASWYVDWLRESGTIPLKLRMDKGNETGDIAALHAYLLTKLGVTDDPMDVIQYGPSTSNQVY